MENTLNEPVTLENSGHALDNAVVLRQIFGELVRSSSLGHLKNARMVTNSSNWQDELLKVWRREAVLVFKDHHQDQSDEPTHRRGTLVDFLGELEDLESPYQLVEVPYERIKIQNMEVRQEVDGPLEKVCNAMGSSVKHLTLQNVTLDMTPKQDLLLFLKAKFPNLETLRLDHVEQPSLLQLFEKGRRTPGHRVTLDKVTKLELGSGRSLVKLKFENLPNLQELKLFGKRSLKDLAKEPMSVIPGVKKIDLLGHALDDRASAATKRLRFPELEHLAVKSTEKLAASFLNAHSGTLKTLELFLSLVYYPLSNPLRTDFSVLTTLRLWGAVMADLSFLRFTPNLKVLHWDLFGYEKESEMRKEIQYYRDRFTGTMISDELMRNDTRRLMEGVELSKLEYCHLRCILKAGEVRTLANWMPHLKTFNAVLNSRGFREVCKRWKKLESLSCFYGSKIRDPDIASPQNEEMETPANGLTDLKDLRSFSFYPECNTSTLSDACVAQGFLQMAQLNKLHIFVSNQFSETSEQLLRERIPDAKIYRHHNNSTEELDCCKLTEYWKLIFGDSWRQRILTQTTNFTQTDSSD